MNTPEEDQRDQWLSELYEEHAKEAIADFKVERLRSFYVQHPESAEGPYRALREGCALLAEHPTAGFVFGAIAIETLLKGTLLRPIVYGLVHDEAAARLVVEVALAGTGISRYATLLIQILADQGGIDLTTHRRPDASSTLWKETDGILGRRNGVLHRAESVGLDEARLAVEVAAYLQELVLPTVIDRLGLHLHDELRICGEHDRSPELEALLRSVSAPRGQP